ncbi:transketolase, pyridine binding domain protein [Thermus thermophilus]|nr:transketolase, pyridine binding domain protein [Thermus thermophilus]
MRKGGGGGPSPLPDREGGGGGGGLPPGGAPSPKGVRPLLTPLHEAAALGFRAGGALLPGKVLYFTKLALPSG